MAKLSEQQLQQELGSDYWEKISKFIFHYQHIELKEFSSCDVMDNCNWRGKSKAVNQVLRYIEFLGRIKGFKKENYCWWEIVNA